MVGRRTGPLSVTGMVENLSGADRAKTRNAGEGAKRENSSTRPRYIHSGLTSVTDVVSDLATVRTLVSGR